MTERETARPSYRLDDLLAECNADAPMPPDDGEWTAGAAVGGELI